MSDSDSPGESGREAGGRAEKDGGPVSFDHHRVVPTSRESQKRLFASRHRRAKKERRGERRRKKTPMILVPLFVAVSVSVVGVALRNMHLADKVAEEKLAREAEVREQREEILRHSGPAVDKVQEAQERYLNGVPSSAGESGDALKK